jgi:LysM repeat protein
MDPRVTSTIFGLVTLGALGFAGFMYFNRSGTTTVEATPSPSVALTASAEPFSLPSPLVSISPSASASVIPTPNRTFSPNQALSLPNEIVTITEGGSLFQVASEHSISTSELANLNGITNPDTVYVGQKLIIPDNADASSYTILFALNKSRMTKEEQKLQNGATSIYSDPISAAQADAKGIYGLASDTPYSKANEQDKAVTLSTGDDKKVVTITMEKSDTGLWYIKKLVIKKTPQATP